MGAPTGHGRWGLISRAAAGSASAALATAILLVLPGGAHSQLKTACDFDPATHVLLIPQDDPTETIISRDADGDILLNGGDCDGATVRNVDEIHTAQRAIRTGLLHFDLSNGSLAPGFTDEAGDSDEIEVVVDSDAIEASYGGGPVRVTMGDADDHLAAGFESLNLNADETDGVDIDIEGLYPGKTVVDGADGDDELSGDGEDGSFYSIGLEGGAGDDRLEGGQYQDSLDGGPGRDRLDGAGSQDRLTGGPGDDELIGGPEAGGPLADGNDVLRPGPGTDSVDGGGDGNGAFGDRVEYVVEGNVILNLSTGVGIAAEDGVDSLQRVENATTGAGEDRITGTEKANHIQTGDGDDVIDTGGGEDWVRPGVGADQVDLGGGDDEVEDFGFDDRGDVLTGGLGDDKIYAGNGDDRLEGQAGEDRLNGGAGADRFDGGPDTDKAVIGGRTAVDASLAADVARFRDGSGEEPLESIENLEGSDGDDVLIGDAGSNEIGSFETPAGADVVRGGAGADRLLGSLEDVIDYSASPGAIIVDPSGSATDGEGATDTIRGFTHIRGTPLADTIHNQGILEGGGGNDDLRGGQNNDELIGGPGADRLSGENGGDRLYGGAGVDVLDGGLQARAPYRIVGNDDQVDSVDYGDSPGGAVVDLASATATEDGYGTSDSLVNIEDAKGSQHADELTGDEGANALLGRGGADRLEGAGGNDRVETGDGDNAASAGAGDDAIVTGTGRDSVNGGPGTDELSFPRSETQAIRVDLSAERVANDGHGSTEPVSGVENVLAAGRGDVLVGDDGPNRFRDTGHGPHLSGGGGNDDLEVITRDSLIEGGAGDDRLVGASFLRGGPGNDSLDGGSYSVFAVADFSDAPRGVTIDGNQNTVDDGQEGTDRLQRIRGFRGSAYADVMTAGDFGSSLLGGGGDDRLTGRRSGDVLIGDAGDDSIDGGPGRDELDGGPGSDEASGGEGPDWLRVRDDTADRAACGPDNDRVTADATAVDTVAPDCETVERPPVEEDGGGSGGGGGSGSGGGGSGGGGGGGGNPPPDPPGDPETPDPGATPPAVTAPPSRTTGPSGTTSPGGGLFPTAPRDARAPLLKLAPRVRNALVMRLSEAGHLSLRVERPRRHFCRGNSRCLRFVAIRRFGQRVRRGRTMISIREILGRRPLAAGRYRISVVVVDSRGNRSPVRRATLSWRG